MKVIIFVDFWNLQLGWNEYHRRTGVTRTIPIPWENVLPRVLVNKAGNGAEYAGTHVYASINPANPKDRSLNSFLQQMDLFSGYKVLVKERKPAKPIKLWIIYMTQQFLYQTMKILFLPSNLSSAEEIILSMLVLKTRALQLKKHVGHILILKT